MALRKKIPSDQAHLGGKPSSTNNRYNKSDNRGRRSTPQRSAPARSNEVDKPLFEVLTQINGKLVAKLFDGKMVEIAEVEIKDLIDTLSTVQPDYIVLDGIITQRLVDASEKSSVKIIAGVNTAAKLKRGGVRVITTS